MKFKYLVLSLIGALQAGVPGSAPRQPAACYPPVDPPRLRISPAGAVDLGELGPLDRVRREYVFQNLSQAPIRLRLYDLSPGARVAGPALERPIPPLAAAGLVLTVDPSGWVGPQSRNIRLGTDDPRQGLYYLPTRMTVRPDLTVDAVQRSFGAVGPGESPRTEFRFVRESGLPLQLRVVTPMPDYLECEVEARGARGKVAFTLRASRVRPGVALGLEQVRVETNAPLQPRFDLYLDWRLHHPIEASPGRVVFLEPEPAALELTLRARNGKPFRVLGVDLEGQGFQAGPVAPGAAGSQTLVIRRTARRPARALLVIRCEGEDPLKVPVAYLPTQPALDESAMVVPSNMPHKAD